MTKADLLDWTIANGCNVTPLPEYKARVIWIFNPRNDSRAFIELPFDDKPVKDYTILRVCMRLRIPVPDFVTYMRPLHDDIENETETD